MYHDLCRYLLGRTKKLTFDELVALGQETDTESRAIHLSKARSYHLRNSQGHIHPCASATTTTPNPLPNGASQTWHPHAIDLSATGGRGKVSEEERAARLCKGCCLFCGGVGHMARHCPYKTKNPFHATSTHMEENLNTNTFVNPNADTFVNPNKLANPFGGSGRGGNRGDGGTGGQGQSGNTSTNSCMMVLLLVILKRNHCLGFFCLVCQLARE